MGSRRHSAWALATTLIVACLLASRAPGADKEKKADKGRRPFDGMTSELLLTLEQKLSLSDDQKEQIVALKFVGFSLKEIGDVLGRDGDLLTALRTQREIMAERRRQIDRAVLVRTRQSKFLELALEPVLKHFLHCFQALANLARPVVEAGTARAK